MAGHGLFPLACAVSLLTSAAQPSPQSLDVGVHHFVDGALLDESRTNGTYFALGQVSKDTDSPLVIPEYPWEQAVHFYTAMLFVPAACSVTGQPAWLLYYACADAVLFYNPISVCVANSSDGRTWHKPLLPYVPYTANGTQPPVNSNIVFTTEDNTFLGQAVLDARPGVPSGQRFVLAYESTTSRYVHVAYSPDGFQFSPSAGAPNAQPAIPWAAFADTMVSVLWDPYYRGSIGKASGSNDAAGTHGRWLAYGRLDKTLPNSTNGCPGGYGSERWVRQSTKDCGANGNDPVACNVSDPSGWTNASVIQSPGYPDLYDCLDSYNPSALLVPDAGTGAAYFMLPSVFRHIPLNESGAPDQRAGGNDGFMDIRLQVSRDGYNFSYPSRDPWIPRGVGARDPASGLYNASGSDRDAGFVFATAGGLLDPDLATNPTAAGSIGRGLTTTAAVARDQSTGLPVLPVPSNYVYTLYWGSQTTHAGGGAYLYRYWPGAFSGIFRAKLRREGWVALANTPTDPTGTGMATTIPLLLPQAPADSEQVMAMTTAHDLRSQAPGLYLRLNAEISAAGRVTVALLDPANGYQPLPGFDHASCTPLYGNGIRQVVSWQAGADLGPLATAGQPIVLQFSIVHTRLYAWEMMWA